MSRLFIYLFLVIFNDFNIKIPIIIMLFKNKIECSAEKLKVCPA